MLVRCYLLLPSSVQLSGPPLTTSRPRAADLRLFSVLGAWQLEHTLMTAYTLRLFLTRYTIPLLGYTTIINLCKPTLYHALSYKVRCYKRNSLLCPKHQVAHAWVLSIETKYQSDRVVKHLIP